MRRNGISIMYKLLLLVGEFVPILVLAIINGSLGFLCAIGITVLGSIAIAQLLGFFTTISFTTLCIAIILLGFLRGALRYLEQYSNHYIAFKLLAVLRDNIFAKLRQLCPAKLETKQKGSIISMITADIEILEVFYAHTMSPVCIAILVSTIMSLFVSYVASPLLALYMVFAYLMLGLVLPLINSRFLNESGVKYRDTFTMFNGFFLDTMKGKREIILHNRTIDKKQEINHYSSALLQHSKELSRRTTRIEAMSGTSIVLVNLIMVMFSLVLLEYGLIHLGQAIVAIVSLMSSLGPVLALNALPNDLTKTFASGDRVLSLMEEEPLVDETQDGESISLSHTEINNLEFSYTEGSKILDEINLSVQKGEIIGIKGGSGNGKSTLLKLIMRFWDKSSGEINLENVELHKINASSLKENVTLVSQTTYLFHGTIEENLRIAKKEATESELISACQKANIHEFITSLAQGYKTIIGGNNVGVSSGEAQRLGLARAFLRDTNLILLDEPTGNVDCINEGIILKSIVENARHKAIIIVSHRDSTLSIADKIYTMKNGKLYE